MRRRYLFIIVIVILFQAFIPSSFFVEAKDDPEVCSGPSEMMSQYFNFQKEAIGILGGSKVEERLMQLTFSKNGMFKRKVLKLSMSAIDLLATNFTVKSTVSNVITSSVLLGFISYSVLESNVDGLAILFKDRPIVRDFKQMLDIETQLFDVAYFRSKQIDLTRTMEGDMLTEMGELIEKYKNNGLLRKDMSFKTGSMAGYIINLLKMNTAMKGFIAFGDELSREELREYLDGAVVKTLDDDYKAARKFYACNSYFKSIKSTLGNMFKNNVTNVKVAGEDMKQAMERLKSALVGKGAWNFKNGRKNMCDNISDYEMAQLKAYWGPDWSCGGFVKASLDVPDLSAVSSALSKAKQYLKDKKVKRKAKKEARKAAKEKEKKLSQSVAAKLQSAANVAEKKQAWYRVYGTGYNPEFSRELNNDFSEEYKEIMLQYQQSQENVIAADISSLFPMGKGIIDQINSTIGNSTQKKSSSKTLEDLNKDLEKIVDKQCSG